MANTKIENLWPVVKDNTFSKVKTKMFNIPDP